MEDHAERSGAAVRGDDGTDDLIIDLNIFSEFRFERVHERVARVLAVRLQNFDAVILHVDFLWRMMRINSLNTRLAPLTLPTLFKLPSGMMEMMGLIFKREPNAAVSAEIRPPRFR